MTAQCTGLNYTTGETPPPVGFTFRHELAWVEFEIKAAQAVTIDFIRLRGIVYQGDISLTPGITSYEASWSNPVRSDADTGEPFVEDTVNIPQDKTSQSIFLLGGNLLLPPQDLTDQQVFTMKWTYTGMEGETRTVNVKMPLAGVSSWEKGKHYVYSAVIPPTPVDITFSVSVKKWKKDNRFSRLVTKQTRKNMPMIKSLRQMVYGCLCGLLAACSASEEIRPTEGTERVNVTFRLARFEEVIPQNEMEEWNIYTIASMLPRE